MVRSARWELEPDYNAHALLSISIAEQDCDTLGVSLRALGRNAPRGTHFMVADSRRVTRQEVTRATGEAMERSLALIDAAVAYLRTPVPQAIVAQVRAYMNAAEQENLRRVYDSLDGNIREIANRLWETDALRQSAYPPHIDRDLILPGEVDAMRHLLTGWRMYERYLDSPAWRALTNHLPSADSNPATPGVMNEWVNPTPGILRIETSNSSQGETMPNQNPYLTTETARDAWTEDTAAPEAAELPGSATVHDGEFTEAALVLARHNVERMMAFCAHSSRAIDREIEQMNHSLAALGHGPEARRAADAIVRKWAALAIEYLYNLPVSLDVIRTQCEEMQRTLSPAERAASINRLVRHASNIKRDMARAGAGPEMQERYIRNFTHYIEGYNCCPEIVRRLSQEEEEAWHIFVVHQGAARQIPLLRAWRDERRAERRDEGREVTDGGFLRALAEDLRRLERGGPGAEARASAGTLNTTETQPGTISGTPSEVFEGINAGIRRVIEQQNRVPRADMTPEEEEARTLNIESEWLSLAAERSPDQYGTVEWPADPEDVATVRQQVQAEAEPQAAHVPSDDNEADNMAEWLASALAEQRDDATAILSEYEDVVVENFTDTGFIEVCAQIKLNVDTWREALGNLVMRRLARMNVASEAGENGTMRFWASRMGMQYFALVRLVDAARNRALVPELAGTPITYQAAIGRGVEAHDPETRAAAIRERHRQVTNLDPEGDHPTRALPEVRGAERVGLEQIEMFQEPEPDGLEIVCVLAGGEVWRAARLTWERPDTEQQEYYQELLRRRLNLPTRAARTVRRNGRNGEGA